MPITADDQEIARCDNKGSYGAPGNVTQTTLNLPHYDTDLHAGGGMIGAGADGLFTPSAIAQVDFNAGNFSVFMIYSNSNSGVNAWWYDWNSSECRMLSLSTSDNYNYAMGGGSQSLSDTRPPADTIIASHQWETGANVQGADISYNVTNGSSSAGSSGPATGQGLYLGSTAGSGYFHGSIHEVCFRTPQLTAQEILDMKAYALGKYGVTWA
jgi:hypothetical protein